MLYYNHTKLINCDGERETHIDCLSADNAIYVFFCSLGSIGSRRGTNHRTILIFRL
jgi:hypothetical protein